MRAYLVDCENHPGCRAALGFVEPANEENLLAMRYQRNPLSSDSWNWVTHYQRQHPRSVLAWVSHNPASRDTQEWLTASPALASEGWTVLDCTSRTGSRTGREVVAA